MLDVNPDPTVFQPQAVEEFKRTMEKLFGKGCTKQGLYFCKNSIKNKDKIYRGTGEALQTYLRENPAVCDQLKIARLRPGGFVATITIGGGKKNNFKVFYMDPHMEYVLYTKYGYEVMACVKPWEQFVTDCKIGRELDPEEAASSAYDA